MVNNVSELERDVQVVHPNIVGTGEKTESVKNRDKKRSLSGFFLAARLVVSAAMFLLSALLPLSERVSLYIFICAFLVAGLDTIIKTVTSFIASLSVFNECFITIAACSAALVTGHIYESAAILILSRLGDILPFHVHSLYRKAIRKLLNPEPDTALILRGNRLIPVPPDQVVPGSIVLLEPNKPVYIDGEIVAGETAMDTSAITGITTPVKLSPGDGVLSGYVNISTPVTIRATASYSRSAATRLIDFSEKAGQPDSRAKPSAILAPFFKAYIPAAIAIAAAYVILQFITYIGNFGDWIHRSLILLSLSCPCALLISVPLTVHMAVAGALKKGIVFSSPLSVTKLAKTKTFIFDKTGTLTTGKYKVVSIEPEGIDARSLLLMAAHALAFSNYPHASAVINAFDGQINRSLISGFRNYNGTGISIMVKGTEISAGSAAFMERLGISTGDDSEDESVIHIAAAGKYAGRILLSDTVKEDAPSSVFRLQKLGVKRIVMLSEDKAYSTRRLAIALGINEFHSECLPEEKLTVLEAAKKGGRRSSPAAFVGNGIGNVPALMQSDVGICLGTACSDVAIEASAVHILYDSPAKVAEAAQIASVSRRITKLNIFLSICGKIIAAALCLTGYIPLWGGLAIEAGLAAVTALNASRAAK